MNFSNLSAGFYSLLFHLILSVLISKLNVIKHHRIASICCLGQPKAHKSLPFELYYMKRSFELF